MKKVTYTEPTVEVVLLTADDVLSNDSSFEPETNPDPDKGIGNWED